MGVTSADLNDNLTMNVNLNCHLIHHFYDSGNLLHMSATGRPGSFYLYSIFIVVVCVHLRSHIILNYLLKNKMVILLACLNIYAQRQFSSC